MANKFVVGDIVRLNALAITAGNWCSNCRDHDLTIIKLPHNSFSKNYTVRGVSNEEPKPENHLKLVCHRSWKERFK